VQLRQDQRQETVQRIDPKLIMANTILQQTAIELVQIIHNELVDNPALDILEEQPPCDGKCLDKLSCPWCSQNLGSESPNSTQIDTADYETVYYWNAPYDPDDDTDLLGNIPEEVSLEDHLLLQARAVLSESDFPIARYIISCLNENGWLLESIEDIALRSACSVDDVNRVLSVVQSLDPPGVAARDLRECLLIQLCTFREEGKAHPIAEKMIADYFEEIHHRKYSRISRAMGISLEEIKKNVEFIQKQLNPYPASQFRPPWIYKPTNLKSTIRPDVIIHRTETGYLIEIPGVENIAIGVNPTYREIYDRLKNGQEGNLDKDAQKHVVEYVEKAELFIRNINQRRRTLKIITQKIIDCQIGFLETGSRSYLRPLTRTQIAEMVNMHESTISRATSRKYVQLPNQEVVSFDVFFTSNLPVKTAVEEIIANEDPEHPLSDREIMDILQEKGYKVARRTVGKYRESANVLSSNGRRR
jgi:RNA polymerase sigma-54 factor